MVSFTKVPFWYHFFEPQPMPRHLILFGTFKSGSFNGERQEVDQLLRGNLGTPVFGSISIGCWFPWMDRVSFCLRRPIWLTHHILHASPAGLQGSTSRARMAVPHTSLAQVKRTRRLPSFQAVGGFVSQLCFTFFIVNTSRIQKAESPAIPKTT